MAHIQIRISHDEKKVAKEVLDKLGLTFSSAIKLFFRQLVRVQGLPFTVSVSEVENAIEEPKAPEIKKEKKKFSNMISSDFSAKKIG
jgi:DNA-damage-inducible protein J